MNDYLKNALDEAVKTGNSVIADAFVKADAMLSQSENPSCSVSGGADSDIMVDLLTRLDPDKRIKYVYFDTGLEYQATKDHLNDLEDKYDIEIIRKKPLKSIPACCREYGQPFVSKMVSRNIVSLQKHGFGWDYNLTLPELIEKYQDQEVPVCYLKWWANEYWPPRGRWNIATNKYLKEFMSEHPPQFLISPRCCDFTKKKVNEQFVKENNIDLDMIGIRKAESGVRANLKTCVTFNSRTGTRYRPLFWFKDEDKKVYENHFNITHSRCYTEYGLKRTGCVGCPFGPAKDDLNKIKDYEPNLYKAATNIFKESYEYTEAYREFALQKKEEAQHD